MSSKITDFFSGKQIDLLSKETGFIIRERNITGSEFLELLLFSEFDGSKLSLENLAEQYFMQTGKSITKQAIDLKFTSATVLFFKILIEKYLIELKTETDAFANFVSEFESVRIKDSTSFQLPEEMKEKYQGSSGAASESAIRIQFEYDLKSAKVYDLSLSAFTKQDQQDAKETVDNVNKSDLIIRDLGYVNLEVIRKYISKEAFFVSRLMSNVIVFQEVEGKLEKVSFGKLHKKLKTNKLQKYDNRVFIGKEDKIEVRMIVEVLPDDVVEQRMRKLNKEAKRKGYKISEENKARKKLNIFITNIEEEKLNATDIHNLYTIRWQIELIFKIWKSIGSINKVKKMKVERFESYLYAKLLWILINWEIVWQINIQYYMSNKKSLSFYKMYKSLKGRLLEFKDVYKSELKLMMFLNQQYLLSEKYHLLEPKKNKLSINELLLIKIK